MTRRLPLALATLAAVSTVAAVSGCATTPPKPSVYYYGDSLANEAASPFIFAVQSSGKAVVVKRTFPGTAPCDWEYDIPATAATHPAAVVLSFSGNDGTACMTKRLGAHPTAAQVASTYEADLNTIVAMLGTGPRIFITAAPEGRNYPTVINGGPELDNASRVVASEHPNTVYVNAGAAVETPSGTFTPTMACQSFETAADGCKSGQIAVRARDGLHFCPTESGPTVAGTCDVYDSGANRYGFAMARPVIAALHL